MTSRIVLFSAALAAFATMGVDQGFALSTKECSVKYQAAKTGGTLNGQTWAEFRKKECAGAEGAAEEMPAPAAADTSKAASGIVFPKSVDAIYAKETAGRARMHTCLDQYRANKGTGSNGGLKWIQKGGGY